MNVLLHAYDLVTLAGIDTRTSRMDVSCTCKYHHTALLRLSYTASCTTKICSAGIL